MRAASIARVCEAAHAKGFHNKVKVKTLVISGNVILTIGVKSGSFDSEPRALHFIKYAA